MIGHGPAPAFVTDRALLSFADLRGLREEARSLYPSAQRRFRSGFRLIDGWQLLGPVSSGFADTGAQLDRIHHELAGRLADLTGPGTRPAMSSYIYYEPGDSIGLHLDQERCQYDVLVLLDGAPGPLCLHPDLANLRPAELRARAVAGVPEPGVQVDLRAGPLVLAGRGTPHHRPPHAGPGTLTLAAFCFGTSVG